MNILEISFDNFESVSVAVNGKTLSENHNCKNIIVTLPDLPTRITVGFSPFKIKPLVRLNGFLLDYWLANIMLYDHQLEFDVDIGFFQKYRQKNLQGRIDSLTEDQKKMDHFWDKYIGINNLHPELVQEIQDLITKQ